MYIFYVSFNTEIKRHLMASVDFNIVLEDTSKLTKNIFLSTKLCKNCAPPQKKLFVNILMLWVLRHLLYFFMSYALKNWNFVGSKTFGSIQFLIQPLSLLQSVRISYQLMCSTCVTYRMPRHATGHQVPPTLFLGRQKTALGVASILLMCLCPHT